MQAQQTIALRSRSFSTFVAVVATLVAAVLALALVSIVDRPVASTTLSVVTLHGVGSDQISHNRSEEGLGGQGSIGGQQIAHNRSEEGLAGS